MSTNESGQELAVGDSAIDRADDDPDEAIVIWRPEDKTISDWQYEQGGEMVTTADENPDHPPDEQLVVVAYREPLDDNWPDWQDTDPDELVEGTAARGITQYGFPASRLQPIEPGELDAGWLDGLADRLEDAGWNVTHEQTALVVEQFNERYRITADGTVHGDGEYQTPLENLIENYRD